MSTRSTTAAASPTTTRVEPRASPLKASSDPNGSSPVPDAATTTPSDARTPILSEAPRAPTPTASPLGHPELERVLASLGQMAEDPSLPRNIRRGAQGAREALTKGNAPVDVRVAGAVGLLDDLANDSNIPVHGRTAIWSLISQLESLQ